MILIAQIIILLLVFISGIIAINTDEHLRPEELESPWLFLLGRIIVYPVAGIILGILGFFLKILGSVGGIFLLLFALGTLIVTLSHLPFLPQIVVVGLHSKHHPKNSFLSGMLNIFASSATLHVIMILSLAHGYYFESMIIMSVFCLGSLYIPTSKVFHDKKFLHPIKFILFILFSLFVTQKGLLYSEKFIFPGLEYTQNAIVPEYFDKMQYVQSRVDDLDNIIIMDNTSELNWLVEGQNSSDKIYIPRFRHRSDIGQGSQTLLLESREPGFIYYTGNLGKGDHIIRVNAGSYDIYNLPYKKVLNSGYLYGIHENEADVEIPEVVITEPGIATLKDGRQYIDLEIKKDGYYPSVLILKMGVPATINFIGTELTELNHRIIMPSYNEYLEFVSGDNPIKLKDPLIDFIFYSWKGDFGGYILVVDDLEGMTKEKAERQIRMFNVNGI